MTRWMWKFVDQSQYILFIKDETIMIIGAISESFSVFWEMGQKQSINAYFCVKFIYRSLHYLILNISDSLDILQLWVPGCHEGPDIQLSNPYYDYIINLSQFLILLMSCCFTIITWVVDFLTIVMVRAHLLLWKYCLK